MSQLQLKSLRRDTGGGPQEHLFVKALRNLQWLKIIKEATNQELLKVDVRKIAEVKNLGYEVLVKLPHEDWTLECKDEEEVERVVEMCKYTEPKRKSKDTQSTVSGGGDRFSTSGSSTFGGRISGSSTFGGRGDRFSQAGSSQRSSVSKRPRDDFAIASQNNSLSKIGSHSRAPKSSETASRDLVPEGRHSIPSSLRAESSKFPASRLPVRNEAGSTPERTPAQASRAFSPQHAAASSTDAVLTYGDSGQAKRARIDQLAGTWDRTPEKVQSTYGSRPPVRAKRQDATGTLPLYTSRTSTPQSSASYGGYRSSFTFGLRNLGNTCYLNAVMQALCSLREFVRDLRAMDTTMPSCRQGELYRCTVDILQQMNSASALQGPLSPAKLRERIGLASPMFRTNSQQDAHEFFLEYINQLHDELLAARKVWLDAHNTAEDAPVLATQQHLDSEVHKELECLECFEPRDVSERFRDFSLDFSHKPIDLTSTTGNRCSLRDMLAAYFSAEVLEAKCESCGHPKAQMKKRLSVPPRVLVLHLKRFVPNFEKQCYEKQHQVVEIPMRFELDASISRSASPAPSNQPASSALAGEAVRLPARPLARTLSQEAADAPAPSPEVSSPAAAPGLTSAAPAPTSETREAGRTTAGPATPLTYSLRSVVAHEGASPHSGHYVCYAQGDNGRWRLYDDSIVSELGAERNLEQEFGRKAYILFYVLQNHEGQLQNS